MKTDNKCLLSEEAKIMFNNAVDRIMGEVQARFIVALHKGYKSICVEVPKDVLPFVQTEFEERGFKTSVVIGLFDARLTITFE